MMFESPFPGGLMSDASRSFNLADLFEIVVDAVPDHLALVAGERRLSYRELDQRANRVAHHLAAAGVGGGDHVAILAYNRAEWLESMIGAFKLRAVPVNVNYRYLPHEIAHVLSDADCVALIGERSLAARLNECRHYLGALGHIVVIEDGSADRVPGAISYEAALADRSPERDFGRRSGDDPYLIYTGGTTGLPKGVLWRSEDIFFAAMGGGSFADLAGPPVTTPDELADRAGNFALRFLVCPPLMHGAGQWISWMGLTTGSTVVLWCERSFAATRALGLAAREQVHVMFLVGDAMGWPIATALATDPEAYQFSSLILIATGVAPMSVAVKEQLQDALGVSIVDDLGGSETGLTGSAIQPTEEGLPRFALRSHVAVLDADLRPVPPGSNRIGMVARSGRIPLGYYSDEAKTRATFKTDPDGRRWALQGDYAKVDAEGNAVLLGRGPLVINTGGEKVHPEEVEAVIKTHPLVSDALVVGVPDKRLGQRVTAVVAPATDATLSPGELVAHCRTRLAGYKVPRTLHLVEQVRRGPAGKADYRWALEVAQVSSGL